MSSPDPQARAVVEESGVLCPPAIVVHGGAGLFASATSERVAELAAGVSAALESGWEVLEKGGRALDAVTAAVASFEASGLFNAGTGAVITSTGDVETDAAVMDGENGAFGAVCAASWPESPVAAARAVAALGGPANGPILLAGAGADRFCEQAGLAPRSRSSPSRRRAPLESSPGTVGAVALDSAGHLAAATSTGGRLGKLPGRVGDSPIAGAGTWADDASVAISATGEGESFILAGFAHRTVWNLASGASLPVALEEALSAVRSRSGQGGAIAIAPDGSFAVVFDTPAMARGWRDVRGPTVPALRHAEGARTPASDLE